MMNRLRSIKEKSPRWLSILFAVAVVLSTPAQARAQDEPSLVVHEWGTITSQHYNDGFVAGGMNVIEATEAVPDFVHRIKDDVLRDTDKGSNASNANQSVTMRLETPVMYFHPAISFDQTQPINVSVEFRGGLLNEFYPDTETSYEGIKFYQSKGAERAERTELTEQTVGTLQWWNLSLGGPWPGPKTEAVQWTAPRQVKAVDVRAHNGESERYLFYRGVAYLNSLLRTKHNMQTRQVTLLSPTDSSVVALTLPSVWLIRVGSNGRLAFKALGALTLTANPEAALADVSADFPDQALSAENVGQLRASMKEALVANGLFVDEAEAMLNTWQHAYFQHEGTRLMFIVPRAWVDEHLPLTISVPAEIVRVFVGRIDLHGI